MRKIRLVLLASTLVLNVSVLGTIISFAAKNNIVAAEQVNALVLDEAGEVEFDEPEIDDVVDAAEAHGTPIDDEKEQEETSTEEKGPGISKKTGQTEEKENSEELTSISSSRQKLVEYALKFVGSKYKYGGNTPSGFDCSGFVQYVYKNALGKTLLRNSASQSTQGKSIGSDEMQMGDLLFYSNGSRINHVAIYIGNGKVVHASNERTGVKISPWNYRNPVVIKSMIE